MTEERGHRTPKEISEMFHIKPSTLAMWRAKRSVDNRLPRYHKLCTGSVYYILSEFEEDLRAMEKKSL